MYSLYGLINGQANSLLQYTFFKEISEEKRTFSLNPALKL